MNTKRANIILSAGAPQFGSQPSFIEKIENKNPVFYWHFKALGMNCKNYIVAGYESEKLKKYNFPGELIINEHWEHTKNGYSLSLVPALKSKSINTILICYGDILFNSSTIKKILSNPANFVIAWDNDIDNNLLINKKINPELVYVKKSMLLEAGNSLNDKSNGIFVGLVKITGTALDHFKKILSEIKPNKLRNICLVEIIQMAVLKGLKVNAFNITNNWAEIGADRDIARFILGTKAETLKRLKPLISKSYFSDQIFFDVQSWSKRKKKILNTINYKFKNKKIIIRSSSKSEDLFDKSNAGSYLSILNVEVGKNLINDIERVISSYRNSNQEDQVLIQPMLEDVKKSGVIFTKTIDFGAPYYVINYDSTGKTENITSGSSNENSVLYILKNQDKSKLLDKDLRNLLEAIIEIEDTLNHDELDIEFAITKNNRIHILQVRPLIVKKIFSNENISEFYKTIERINNRYNSLIEPKKPINGEYPLYGIMPDWNPAEIIGINPGNLALSLYKYLITDEIWAQQRYEFGYKDLRYQPLLVSFEGKPYVDVRVSFNSFLPNNLNESESKCLINFYLKYLINNPQYHDKIEFEVIPTCIDPYFDEFSDRLKKDGKIDEKIIRKLKIGLLKITNKAIKSIDEQILKLNELNHNIKLKPVNTERKNIKALLDECKLLGTLPFAHLARHGFIAMSMLKGALYKKWLTNNAYNEFMESICTVSQELIIDANKVSKDKISFNKFLLKYGHLRPGTYDISSPAYRDDPKRFLNPIIESSSKLKIRNINNSNWNKEKERFFKKLQSIGIKASGSQIETYLKKAIEWREKAKFIFSYNLSQSLSLIKNIPLLSELKTDQISNLSIEDIFKIEGNSNLKNEEREKIRVQADKNKKKLLISSGIKMPVLLKNINDIKYFQDPSELPNFIGVEKTISKTAFIKTHLSDNIDIYNKIVFILKADPGYDWIFSQNISGLITAYGGANSHMAIRAAEFGLPAAIGIGEQLFKKLVLCKELELDPCRKIIRRVFK